MAEYNINDNELNRLESLNQYENKLRDMGYNVVAGIDEVGRGPLAGPVVACCLVLPKDARISGVDDSKKLSAKKREQLYPVIMSEAEEVGVGIVSVADIDEINILNATHKAMLKAIERLKRLPEAVIIDGREVPCIPPGIFQMAVVKGDRLSMAVAAASVVAKVTRDRMMLEYHDLYPHYGFNKNMGYGTAFHIEAIKKYGLSPIHRISFTRKFVE